MDADQTARAYGAAGRGELRTKGTEGVFLDTIQRRIVYGARFLGRPMRYNDIAGAGKCPAEGGICMDNRETGDARDALCRRLKKVSRINQFDYLILLMECRILPAWFEPRPGEHL